MGENAAYAVAGDITWSADAGVAIANVVFIALVLAGLVIVTNVVRVRREMAVVTLSIWVDLRRVPEKAALPGRTDTYQKLDEEGYCIFSEQIDDALDLVIGFEIKVEVLAKRSEYMRALSEGNTLHRDRDKVEFWHRDRWDQGEDQDQEAARHQQVGQP